MQWVSVSGSLDTFETTVISICSKISCETRIFCQLIAGVGLQMPCNIALSFSNIVIYRDALGPPDPTVIIHIRKVSSMMFTHPR